jgi:hypothetical protein
LGVGRELEVLLRICGRNTIYFHPKSKKNSLIDYFSLYDHVELDDRIIGEKPNAPCGLLKKANTRGSTFRACAPALLRLPAPCMSQVPNMRSIEPMDHFLCNFGVISPVHNLIRRRGLL